MTTPFGEAPGSAWVEAVAALVAEGEGAQRPGLTSEQYTLVRGVLSSVLRGRVPLEEIDEALDEAILRFLSAVGETRAESIQQPSGYLKRVAINVALDRRRSAVRRQEVPLEPIELEVLGPQSDDDVAALLDERATAMTVRLALGALREAGDVTAFKVATYLLDQAELTGRLPSLRQVGKALGMSDVGASKALRRIRPYLAPLKPQEF